MSDSIELTNLKNKYNLALKKVYDTANKLSISINSLNSIITTNNDCYSVDDVQGGTNYLNDLLEQEKYIYSYIVDVVIPSTNTLIDNLDIRIENAIAEENL